MDAKTRPSVLPYTSPADEAQSNTPATYTNPCHRCGFIFEYPAGVEWRVVEKMVIDHWEICPNTIRATLKREGAIPSDAPTASEGGSRSSSPGSESFSSEGFSSEGGAPSAPEGDRFPGKGGTLSAPQGEGPSIEADSPSAPVGESSTGARRRRRPVMTEAQRIKLLEDDEWTAEIEVTSVKCLACGRTVSLDKRSRFYPGLWFKHRRKCVEIKRLEAIREAEEAGRR